MERLDHGHAILAEVFNYLETVGLVVRLGILINGIVNMNFDADGFFIFIGILGRFNKR